MKPRILLGVGLALLVLACQVIPTPPPLTATPPGEPLQVESTPTRALSTPVSTGSVPTPTSQDSPPNITGGLPPFPLPTATGFSGVRPAPWTPAPYAGKALSLPFPLKEAANYPVAEGLTLSQRAFLETNGFVVLNSREAGFSELRLSVASQQGQPYYLSADAAFHALQSNLKVLIPVLERDELYPRLLAVTDAVYRELLTYLPLVSGTALEADALLAAAYMGVGLRLLDPQAELDTDLGLLVDAQVAQILAAGGPAASTLIPAFQDDFSAYQPRGHYAGDPILESYFRALTWYARVHFPLSGFGPQSPPSRAPLLITLALRQATTPEGEPAAEEWFKLNQVLTYLWGGTPYDGPPEYAALMDQIYGPRVTLIGLADEPLWDTFQALSGGLPTAGGPVSFSAFLEAAARDNGWRFMGERFIPETFIFENLVYDRVSSPDNRRDLPSGLDILGVLGSQAAQEALDARGDSSFLNYLEQLTALQDMVAAQSAGEWLSSAPGAWMYAIYDLVSSDDLAAYPDYMGNSSWGYRALDGGLSSWLEWAHAGEPRDIDLPAGIPEGRPLSNAPPCYVSSRPQVFYRLAYLAGAMVDGLDQVGMLGSEDGPDSLGVLTGEMLDLADRYGRLGDIAAKQLAGESLDASDCALVGAPLGSIEARLFQNQLLAAQQFDEYPASSPVPFITDLAETAEHVLQAGLGPVNRIYVLVPIDGQVFIAQGGVFAYQEFILPIEGKLSADDWQMLISNDPLDPPPWTGNYTPPGGSPVDVLAFRTGDVYRLTLSGGGLGLRAVPERNSRYLNKMDVGDYLAILEGPTQADGLTWWKFQTLAEDEDVVEGWAPENEAWFERAWGQ